MVTIGRSQGRELKQELEAETMEEPCLRLISGSHLASFLTEFRTTCLGMGTAYSGLSPPTSLTVKANQGPAHHLSTQAALAAVPAAK